MKRIITLALSLVSVATFAANFTTPGTGKKYGFSDIAKLDSCVLQTSPNRFLVQSPFTVAAGDTLSIEDGAIVLMGNTIEVTVEGDLIMTPEVQALITRANETCTPKGFYAKNENSHVVLRNLCVEYAQVRQFSLNGLLVEDCVFRNTLTKASSAAAIVSTKTTTSDNVIRNCRFYKTASAIFSTGANVASGVQIIGNYIYDCNTGNSNRPMINLTVGGNNNVVVKDNVIIGTGRTKVGGITVANLMGISGTNNVLIENNAINDCRYGMNVQGYNINAYLLSNSIVNNHFEPTPANGGSGIAIQGPVDLVATGNYIEGNLWGVTVLGSTKSINFGKTDDPNADDYNPGYNVFKNNGNNGTEYSTDVIYDMFNNTTNETTIYAQGNVWTAEAQDSIEIQKGVHDSLTDGKGRIIFATASKGEATNIAAVSYGNGDNGIVFDGEKIYAKNEGRVNIYNLNGVLIKSSMSATEGVSVSAFQPGVYVARNMTTGEAIRFNR